MGYLGAIRNKKARKIRALASFWGFLEGGTGGGFYRNFEPFIFNDAETSS
jgi:hypothetical protein